MRPPNRPASLQWSPQEHVQQSLPRQEVQDREDTQGAETTYTMTNIEKLLLSKALDSLWGAIDAAGDIMQMQLDHKDGRLEAYADALSQAQDAIIGLNELFGIEK